MAQHILLLVVIGICVFHTTYGDHTSNCTAVLQPILIVSSFLLLYFCLVAMNLRMMIFCYLILVKFFFAVKFLSCCYEFENDDLLLSYIRGVSNGSSKKKD